MSQKRVSKEFILHIDQCYITTGKCLICASNCFAEKPGTHFIRANA